MAAERIETEAPSDMLGAYLATVPRGLSAAAWARWRGKNSPPYLRAETRRGDRCGVCGGELTAWLRFCLACSRREFHELDRRGQMTPLGVIGPREMLRPRSIQHTADAATSPHLADAKTSSHTAGASTSTTSRGGRTIHEERREYPAQGIWRPAMCKRWFVVLDADGAEVTRCERRTDAERYLS
jgi:hypothetical protein